MVSEDSPFSASDSALGYLFQCRYALLASLRRCRSGDEFLVSIETLDDVVFEPKGSPPELLQTKHHLRRPANLSDASVDLWKTIRIWTEGTVKGDIPDGSLFFLLTTSHAPTGSAASYLRAAGRDVDEAFKRLVATAQTSTNRENGPAYSVFLSNQATARRILDNVLVLDAAETITDLEASLRNEIWPAVRKSFIASFIERLEGWWFARAIRQMAGTAGPILSNELEDEFDDLREQFREDNLPIDDSVLDADIDHDAYLDEQFVRQLRLINIQNPRILIAIREYFRAFEQRSRWIREDLLLVGELDRYERRLVEEWQIWFERMREELGEKAAEEQKVAAAQAVYRWVESQANYPIRPRCSEPFVTRGSFHILANGLKVGWHPDFLERLKRTLESEANP